MSLLPPESLLTLLDTLFANTLVGLAFIDRDLRFVRINDALATMNGQSASSHIGQPVRDVLPHLADRLEPLYRSVFTNLQPILNLELRGETWAAPGDERHWLMSCYPVAAPAAPPIGLGVIVVEISAVRYADQALRTYADQMRALSLRLVNAQETERRALAHELHDEIGQMLTGLNMVLEAGTQETAEQIRARLRTAQQVVTTLTGQVRQMSLDLLPPMLDDLGLLPTLHWYIRRYHEQTHIAVDFKYRELPTPLPLQVVIVAYRIVQEGLTNVARYAQVDHAAVQIWLHQGDLAITIEDEGCGFDVAAARRAHHSVGLVGMHERVLLVGGQFRIDSAPGEGTRLYALLPLTSVAAAEEGR